MNYYLRYTKNVFFFSFHEMKMNHYLRYTKQYLT